MPVNTRLAAKDSAHVRASGWSIAAAAFAAAVLALVVAYWPTVRTLVWVWAHDGTYQYAFLIFPVSLWVAWTLRHQLRAQAPRPSAWGLLAVAVLACVWYAGNLLDINLPQHFGLVAMFPALVLACLGWRALWVLAFPLGYLVVFAVPWGDGLVGPLQDITARFAVHALDVTGIPVLLNGREILTPSATWMVEDACSGVKFFIACTALGCLYAWLMYRHWWKRMLFVVLAAVVPVIANGLRVYFTILIGETFGVQYAHGTDHMIFGWQFFGTVLVLLLLVGWFFRDRLVLEERPAANTTLPAAPRTAIWAIAIALLVAAPLVAAALASEPTAPEALHLAPPAVAGWKQATTRAADWHPHFAGPAGEFRMAYVPLDGGTAVELFHAVYTGKPRRGHTLITYGNDVYDPADSRILSTASRAVAFANGGGTRAGELRLTGAAGSRLVWYWYCIGDRCTPSPVLIKLLQAWAVLRGQTPRSSVWALSSATTNGNDAQVRVRLRAFAKGLPKVGPPGSPVARPNDVAGGGP